MADQKLNEIPQVQSSELANVKAFFALMANGEIKQMSKEDMASVVGELLKSDGYLKFKDYGQLLTPDFTTKDAHIGFGYSTSDDGSGYDGLFLSVSNADARFQIKSNLNAPQLKFRQTNFNNYDTTGWVEIKI